LIFARQTSAIPPAARRESIRYLLNSVPGSQGDGDGAPAGADPVCVAEIADSPDDACHAADAEDEPLSSRARDTTGVADQRR
jgi:hypothetical protein